uniref:Late blight resistance protein homolog R1B-17 n=1 Tax=Nicotiana sylvestris TaxID=4096 RepID=A0A1U7VHS2_NICSY
VDVAEDQHNKLKTHHQDCATQLISKAYEVEYIVDACARKEVPDWCLEHWLLNIIQEITVIRANVVEIPENKVHDSIGASTTVHMSTQLTRNRSMNAKFVGFEDVDEELRRRLIKEPKDLDVISIIGIPGLDKTTLAYKLYSDESVVSHFDIRAQC